MQVNAEDSFTFPPSLFHEDKAFLLIDIPFSKRMKINLKTFSKSSTISQMENTVFDKMDYKERKEFKR